MTTAHKIIIVLISIIIISVIIYYASEKYMNTKQVNEPQVNTTNEIFDKYLNNVENKNQVINEAVTNNSENQSQTTQKVQTIEDKVIEMAKNKWGAEDNTVRYEIAKQEGNEYYVSVIKNDTTEVLAWYKVNVENGEVSGY